MEIIIFGASVSGKSLARYFFKSNQKAFLYDDNSLDNDAISFFTERNIEIISEKKFFSLLQNQACGIILSPGVSLFHPLVLEAKRKKQSIVSETEFGLSKIKNPIIAITGTNGKSTVASMCHHILNRSGYKTALVGNIGKPVTELLLEKKIWNFLVLEVSSYQLEQMLKNKFLRCVFLNFSKDHLERHKTLKRYFKAKWRIFDSTNKKAIGYCSEEIKDLAQNFGLIKNKKIPLKPCISKYYTQFIPENLKKMKHNKENAMTSLKICSSVSNKSAQELSKALMSFKSIPHRFENFAKQGKLIFIDDSKATNVHATLAALSSSQGKVLLLLGGLSKKGEDFSKILSYQSKIQKVLSFGEASDRIKMSLKKSLSVESFDNLHLLMKNLKSFLNEKRSIKTILFSPACASFDEFQNFSDRGRFFQKEVKKFLMKKDSSSEKRKKNT